MSENAQPANGGSADAPGIPFYEKSRQQLKELLQKRRQLERQLVRARPPLPSPSARLFASGLHHTVG